MKKIPGTSLLVFAIALRLQGKTGDRLIPPAQRKTAPDFTLVNDQGLPLTLSAFKGQVVLLDFWATWCHGCIQEIPWYIEFQHQYRAKGLQVVGVSMDDGGMVAVKPFLVQKHMDYPVVIGDETLGHRYGLQSMPMTLLLDRTGKVALAHVGVVDRSDFETRLRELLLEGK